MEGYIEDFTPDIEMSRDNGYMPGLRSDKLIYKPATTQDTKIEDSVIHFFKENGRLLIGFSGDDIGQLKEVKDIFESLYGPTVRLEHNASDRGMICLSFEDGLHSPETIFETVSYLKPQAKVLYSADFFGAPVIDHQRTDSFRI